jgi:CheY-like chemotaxis protein
MTAFLKAWLAQVLSDAPGVPAARELGILIVDDLASACLYADRVLRLAGYRAVVASSGPEAIQKAAAMPRVDVLVTDLSMPGMNGDELARSLRQRNEGLKVLYVTGFGGRLLDESDALRNGDAFLEKPYSMGALEHAFSIVAYGDLGRFGRAPACAAAPALWM